MPNGSSAKTEINYCALPTGNPHTDGILCVEAKGSKGALSNITVPITEGERCDNHGTTQFSVSQTGEEVQGCVSMYTKALITAFTSLTAPFIYASSPLQKTEEQQNHINQLQHVKKVLGVEKSSDSE